MASKLRLKKRKHHPPMQEPPNVTCEKITEEPEQSNLKTYTEVASSSTQMHATELPKRTNVKTYAEIANSSKKINNTEETKKTNKNTDAQNARTSTQIFDEHEIFTSAIESAKKHNIQLQPGRKDRGYGNCAFEAVINNINDRACFRDKLLQTPNWYRRIWMAQMMQRIIMGTCPWNPGYTEQQIREGFEKLQESGVYEIDFFGDMMIVGISCGIRKRILIFNTSENLLHDPISVIDPRQYEAMINIDNETPVVVAYSGYHYENLHPEEEDRRETMRLVDSYTKGRYDT